MDPLTTTALSTVIAGVLKKASEDAGASALAALRKLLRREGGDTIEEGALAQLESAPDAVDAERVTEQLVVAARADAELERELVAWVERTRPLVDNASVSNTNTGSVSGPLVQGRDFSGPISFS